MEKSFSTAFALGAKRDSFIFQFFLTFKSFFDDLDGVSNESLKIWGLVFLYSDGDDKFFLFQAVGPFILFEILLEQADERICKIFNPSTHDLISKLFASGDHFADGIKTELRFICWFSVGRVDHKLILCIDDWEFFWILFVHPAKFITYNLKYCLVASPANAHPWLNKMGGGGYYLEGLR